MVNVNHSLRLLQSLRNIHVVHFPSRQGCRTWSKLVRIGWICAFASAQTATLKPSTYLNRSDGKRVFLAEYLPPTIDGMGAKFIFPKNVDGQPLLTKDFSSVRFYSEVGKQVKLDVRFKVADMYYNGRLEY